MDGIDQRQALPTAAESAGFQARLERLEKAVFSKQDDRPSAPTAAVPSIRGALATTVIPGLAFYEEHEVTSRWLEGIGTLENPLVDSLLLLRQSMPAVPTLHLTRWPV